MRKDLTRRIILDAALAEFLAHGHVAAGMEPIAARGQESKVTVYAYVTDRRGHHPAHRAGPAAHHRSFPTAHTPT
ncbi:hypothetical protein [Micromonospora endophytica]|uniref:Uncharacterized protein n=1 Tax=Micromonospora endophytica TaxID=515350 RepID=A0A2W2BDC1_9ACTN|nr:hypothetical protein [Micromonospora endophytica]PZF83310.1 hypothetical protein C1I93_30140 [Micromonospora endophytica]RIW41546.1 hypothetical protein D3H59_25825 [Micromonospora endophytica]BCJ61408.1 hypothetical protein Jiend_48300 [Micromonospora endophytica]